MMRKMWFRFFSAFLSVLVLCVSLCGMAFGADVEYIQKPTFWHWLNGQGSILNGIIAYGLGQACPNSDDGYHRSNSYKYESSLRGGYLCICDYCDAKFIAYETDLQQSYDAYVADLPASGYTSDNGLIWQPTIADAYDNHSFLLGNTAIYESENQFTYDSSVPCIMFLVQRYSGNSSDYNKEFTIKFRAPISASYIPLDSRAFSYYVLHRSGESSTGEGYYSLTTIHRNQNDMLSSSMLLTVRDYQSIRFECFFPVYKLIPDTTLSGNIYNITTRPTSITGGNYGIIGDNGQIVKVEDNSTIVNETNNTVWNPVTGSTSNITDWSYDYSTRTYTVTLENGTTQTITYGDENITIKEGDIVYNVYYLADGSGSETPPEACAHEWTETSRTEPTCTAPGRVSSACSKCQQTKTEAVPALGHDWQVKQTVTTEYDDTGQLVQEGYILYECSRCQEQYKSTGGTVPPGGEGDSTTIGGLIEKLLGGIGDVVKGIIKGILTLLTKAVEALQGIGELFTSFVSSVIGLFGGFTDFLSAVFPFLPGEFVAIIELGLLLLVAAAVLRKFLS